MVMLLQYLDRSQFELHLALVDAAGPYLKDVPVDVSLHDLKARRVRQAMPAIIRLCWKLRPHVVHSSLCELNIAMAMMKPFLPPNLSLLIREDSAPSPQNTETRRHPRLWNWLCRHFYPKADKVICVGDFVLNDLADNFGVPRSKTVRVYNPVDIDCARRLAEESSSPYAGEGPHLVAAGRLSKEKGFDILFDAMRGVSEVFPQVDLTILGDGPLRKDLVACRDRLGLSDSVHFLGFQTNPYPYFKYADLLVLPSRFEAFGLVLIEALAVGTPVVASDCPGGVREAVGNSSIARLVPPSDPVALGDAIVSALRSNTQQPNAGTFFCRFDVKNIAREYENILQPDRS